MHQALLILEQQRNPAPFRMKVEEWMGAGDRRAVGGGMGEEGNCGLYVNLKINEKF